MDEAVSESRRQYPIDAPRRPAAARAQSYARSYDEVRRLVLMLAEQSGGGEVTEELKRIVVRADCC
ncbi:MAG: hypothetical protein JOY82_08295 [Streptosporangiaceae bacterium]|nr:hypothetical protein [Streptosporangiaceae bacterium]MBV9854513.1 hypothetical protein [Streptosporangiaceae bacterium]